MWQSGTKGLNKVKMTFTVLGATNGISHIAPTKSSQNKKKSYDTPHKQTFFVFVAYCYHSRTATKMLAQLFDMISQKIIYFELN